MSIETTLQTRSESKCELCTSADSLAVYEVQPKRDGDISDSAYLCSNCIDQVENSDRVLVNHWRCLNTSMWSEVPAVQVLAWRMLNQLKGEGWPQELLDMLFLEEETAKWAQAFSNAVIHVDANGAVLASGDNVVLIQDLKVKGAGFTAKRGTAVRRISLVVDNAAHIEGKIDGQRIVILTKYVKKK